MKLFTKPEQDKISEAVTKAESTTSGEIATAVIAESDTYAGYEWSGALFLGFISFLILLWRLPQVEQLLESRFWEYGSFHLVTFIGVVVLVITLGSYRLLNVAFFNRLIIPKDVLSLKVRQRALVHFVESGVAETKDRTGILIFISLRERRVELIADRGISEKIDSAVWDEIVSTIISGIKEKRAGDGLIDAIGRCSEVLTEQFPIAEDDTNELSNSIAILEK